jgi:hypothetical protein
VTDQPGTEECQHAQPVTEFLGHPPSQQFIQHAWSTEPVEEWTDRRPLSRGLKIMLAVVGVGLIAVGGMVIGFWVTPKDAAPAVAELPPPTSVPIPPPEVIDDPSNDHAYLDQLNAGGHWQGTGISKNLLNDGHMACQQLRSRGHPSVDDVANYIAAHLHDDQGTPIPLDGARDIVVAAQDHFCRDTK